MNARLYLSSGFFELFVEEGVILASLLSQLLKSKYICLRRVGLTPAQAYIE